MNVRFASSSWGVLALGALGLSLLLGCSTVYLGERGARRRLARFVEERLARGERGVNGLGVSWAGEGQWEVGLCGTSLLLTMLSNKIQVTGSS